MERLNFNHLYYFRTVARTGSIKEAAEKLHVSQPTISDQIKLLEEFFQCRLFDRKHKTLVLNQRGKLALEYAERIFQLSTELTSNIRNEIKIPKDSLDIGITHHMTQYFLYENILPLFEQSQISINVVEKDRHYLIADLDEGEIDIFFTDSRDSLFDGMIAHRVGVNRTFAVCHKKLKRRGRKFPEVLNEIPYFSHPKASPIGHEIEIFFSKNSLTPRVIGEGDDIDLFELVTENGIGFTIVPEAAKLRFTMNPDIIVLGEIKELQTSVWGVVKKDYKGLGYQLLTGKL